MIPFFISFPPPSGRGRSLKFTRTRARRAYPSPDPSIFAVARARDIREKNVRNILTIYVKPVSANVREAMSDFKIYNGDHRVIAGGQPSRVTAACNCTNADASARASIAHLVAHDCMWAGEEQVVAINRQATKVDDMTATTTTTRARARLN